MLTNFKIKSQLLLGSVSRSVLLIRNNEKPRAELYRSTTSYSQNILSNAILKPPILNISKHLLTSKITLVLNLSNQENLLIKVFSDLEEIT